MQFFALASALLPLTTAAAYAQAAQVDRIEFTEYGIYTVDRVIQEKDAAGINKGRGVERSSCGNAANGSRANWHHLRLPVQARRNTKRHARQSQRDRHFSPDRTRSQGVLIADSPG